MHIIQIDAHLDFVDERHGVRYGHGNPMRRASGAVLTYRESVPHQAIASWACLEALRTNADYFLSRYLADARRVVADTPENQAVLVVRPRGNETRVREFIRILTSQGIEVERALAPFGTHAALDRFGLQSTEPIDSPAGSLIIRPAQPLGRAGRAN